MDCPPLFSVKRIDALSKCVGTLKIGVFVMCVSRKTVISVLENNGFKFVPNKVASTHWKYSNETGDKKVTVIIKSIRNSFSRIMCHKISKQTN